MTSLFSSASTSASCTHLLAVSKSTISPFRTPREGAWPTPSTLTELSGFDSPTTTHTFEVPISRPTMMLSLLIGMLLEAAARFLRGRGRFVLHGGGLFRGRGLGRRLLLRRRREGHGHIALDHKVDGLNLLLSGVDLVEKNPEPVQLPVQPVEPERDPLPLLVGDDHAVHL